MGWMKKGGLEPRLDSRKRTRPLKPSSPLKKSEHEPRKRTKEALHQPVVGREAFAVSLPGRDPSQSLVADAQRLG